MKWIKRISFLFILISSSLYALPNRPIGNEGGGGDELIVKFIKTSNDLINSPIISEEHREVLRTALDSSRIVVVKKLKNPLTNEEIPNQKTIIAWGSPNLIQLKLSSGALGEESWEGKVNSLETVAHIVFHELYRASGIVDVNGESPDEYFQLSISKYGLDHFFVRYEENDSCDEKEFAYVKAKVRAALPPDMKILKIGIEITERNYKADGEMRCYYDVGMYGINNGRYFSGYISLDKDFWFTHAGSFIDLARF